jgi:glycerol-3-phosphate O-acyltransferase
VASARLGERIGELASDGEARRQVVQAVANRVAFGISKAVTVTPVGLVSAALLSHVHRGLTAAELTRRVELLRAMAAEGGARFGRGLEGAGSDPRLPGPVQDAVARLVASAQVTTATAAGETIYQVVDEKRPLLDYHRNAVIHRYVAPAIVSAALLGGAERTRSEVRRRAAWLSRLFKLEFTYEPGVELAIVFEQNVERLQRLGAIELEGDRIRPGVEQDRLQFLSEFLRPYLEAYRLAAATADALLDDASRQAIDPKGLLRQCLDRGRADFLSGRILTREALSKPTLENSIEWMLLTGRIVDRNGRLGRAPKPDALREIIDGITRHLSP